MKPEAGKRIVSKEEYALARERRQGLTFVGLVLCTVTVACAGVVIVNSVNIINIYSKTVGGGGTGWESYDYIILGFICIVFGYFACIAGWHTKKTIKEVAVTNPALLFTIADLPASDSLVRASQEPLQAQETVLLRAAREGVETREEELLRASVKE